MFLLTPFQAIAQNTYLSNPCEPIDARTHKVFALNSYKYGMCTPEGLRQQPRELSRKNYEIQYGADGRGMIGTIAISMGVLSDSPTENDRRIVLLVKALNQVAVNKPYEGWTTEFANYDPRTDTVVIGGVFQPLDYRRVYETTCGPRDRCDRNALMRPTEEAQHWSVTIRSVSTNPVQSRIQFQTRN